MGHPILRKSHNPHHGITAIDAAANVSPALVGLGATNILVPNLPDLGNTPVLYGTPFSAYASGFSTAFNVALLSKPTDFQADFGDVILYTIDMYSLFEEFTSETFPWEYMFWDDGFHPSAAGHYMVYRAALDTMLTPVQGAILLMGSGLVGLIGFRRRYAA